MTKGRTKIRIVVAGDRGTGKSSLIKTAITLSFPAKVHPVLPPTRLPEHFFPENLPITIIDTSSREEDNGKVAEELKRADVILLTYACDRPQTIDRLTTFWLPKLHQLEVKVPLIVAGCKLDLRDENLEHSMSAIMQQFPEIKACIECSAYKLIDIPEVFYYAQKAVLYPIGPLFDTETKTLKPLCECALKRIFILCDRYRVGALSDVQLNDFQVKCFGFPFQDSEIRGLKRTVQEKLPAGVNERGLTLEGFLFLHALYIEKGRTETTWIVLRAFGYNDDIKLEDDRIPSPLILRRAPDQSVELTDEAIEFLMAVFDLFDSDGDGALQPHELEELFLTAPKSPFTEAFSKELARRNAFGGLSLDAFLSEWALMTLLDPTCSMENLLYIGYIGDLSSAIRVTRTRRLDRKRQQSQRSVFQCFVFGPKKSGKSALLDSFLGRPFSYHGYTAMTDERYAANIVYRPDWESKKTLVLQEIPEDEVSKLFSRKDSLAACDVAVFVYDASDESSWNKATKFLVEVAGHGERTGFKVPCLFVAAKNDLYSFPLAIQRSTRVSQDMGVVAPVRISTKWGIFNNVFHKIVSAAEHPHLSIPEIEAGRRLKQCHRLINWSLMIISVETAVAIVGLAAYRVYAARKNTSS
ncbi:mitochondrial Rho GTPase 1 [Ziziphus jujuba]|uniref:Mitochondrial Rho GTPase n=1 Tax=Ziziphus jujuba TaxID=326968 RepID=A0ABM3IVV2_ZIZJJ|nr:mitochondrial Rho GTPase 1 [Ziziphus jujuba]